MNHLYQPHSSKVQRTSQKESKEFKSWKMEESHKMLISGCFMHQLTAAMVSYTRFAQDQASQNFPVDERRVPKLYQSRKKHWKLRDTFLWKCVWPLVVCYVSVDDPTSRHMWGALIGPQLQIKPTTTKEDMKLRSHLGRYQ